MDNKRSVVKISPYFGLIFSCALLFSILSIGICLWISFFNNPTELQKDLFKVCLTTWQILIGAVSGLLVGKSI